MNFKWLECKTVQNGKVIYLEYHFHVDEDLHKLYYREDTNNWILSLHCETGIARGQLILESKLPADKQLEYAQRQAEVEIITYMHNQNIINLRKILETCVNNVSLCIMKYLM